MVTLQEFKIFAKIRQDASPGTPASGIIVISRADQDSTNIIQVPANTEFHTQEGLTFSNSEMLELNQSERFQPIAVTCSEVGEEGNIKAGRTWSSAIAGIVVTNPADFSNGQDPKQKIINENEAVDWVVPDDSLILRFLDLARANVRTKLGYDANEALPDNSAVHRSVCLFAQFYLQNRETQEVVTEGNIDPLKKSKTEYYRERTWRAINMEIDNILRPYIRVDKFQAWRTA